MSKNTRWSDEDFKSKGLIQQSDGRTFRSGLPSPVTVITPKGNRKIKNATKVVYEGITFDSQLELYMYKLLQGAGISFEYQVMYVLQDKFSYGTENIRAITLTVDFLLTSRDIIIDTKGYANDTAPLKHKMLKKHLADRGEILKLELPANKKDCELLLNRLLYEK